MKECRICKQTLPLSEFYFRETGRPRNECKVCKSGKVRERQLAFPEEYRKQKKKSKYQITDEEYARTVGQLNCPICEVKFEKEEDKNFDHCHASGSFRDVLCHKCNKGLGFFEDNIDNLLKAIQYLRRHRYE